MINLAIDYGNSAAKVGIFEHRNLVQKQTFRTLNDLQQFIRAAQFDNIIVSSVNVNPDDVLNGLSKSVARVVLSPATRLPIHNKYATPDTLGQDRIAGACGAREIFPNENCLVIDAGTCITFDFIDREANFRGGAISPGLDIRFKALNTFTAKLPLISRTDDPPLIGDSTASCIQSGVVNGAVAELRGIISDYSRQFEGLRAILSGGDALFFEKQLKTSIFASPDLVLIGLNSILNHNVSF